MEWDIISAINTNCCWLAFGEICRCHKRKTGCHLSSLAHDRSIAKSQRGSIKSLNRCIPTCPRSNCLRGSNSPALQSGAINAPKSTRCCASALTNRTLDRRHRYVELLGHGQHWGSSAHYIAQGITNTIIRKVSSGDIGEYKGRKEMKVYTSPDI